MLVLIWAAVLFAVRGIHAEPVSNEFQAQDCQNGSGISLEISDVTADAGKDVLIRCSLKTNYTITNSSVSLYKCEANKSCHVILDSRYSRADSTFSAESSKTHKNCSIIFRNLTQTDTAFYRLKVTGTINSANVCMFSNVSNITVKADAGLQHSTRNESRATSDAEKSGHHNCTAQHANTSQGHEPPAVSCVCVGETLSLPSIKWQQTDKAIVYSLSSAAKCTVTVRTTNVSSNSDATITWTQDPMKKLMETAKQVEVISAFCIGVVLATTVSMVVCCLMRIHRKKLNSYENWSRVLEMRDVLEVEEDPEAAVGAGPVAARNSDVDYSTIKFSAMKRAKTLEEGQETTETEYAEIKREEAVQEQEGEASQEEAALIEQLDLAENWEGEDVALCPDVEVAVSEMEACSVSDVQHDLSD